MDNKLVSVICISYNHERFIQECVESVMNQSYQQIELILVDDHSSDGTGKEIHDLKNKYPGIKTLFFDRNSGNCKAFNSGLALAKGSFIIDLAADDIIMENRIKAGIDAFENHDDEYGVNFTDAVYIDENSRHLHPHYKRKADGRLKQAVPEGNIYAHLLERYFICAPTMMIKKEVFDKLKGYDEALAYEDFDFWIRSSRHFKYCYTDAILIKKRTVKGSLSTKQYVKGSTILESTYQVCLKAEQLNETKRETRALVRRSSYEFRKALFTGNFTIAKKFAALIAGNTNGLVNKFFYFVFSRLLA